MRDILDNWVHSWIQVENGQWFEMTNPFARVVRSERRVTNIDQTANG